jgi:hypothetical protein
MWVCQKKSNFQFPTIGNTNKEEEQICEVGLTKAPLKIWPFNNVWFLFKKIQILGTAVLSFV